MSVYTTVNAAQLETLLQQYKLGSLQDFRGIEAGIENTNYFVVTTAGEFVLTIFEHSSVEDLAFDLQIMDHIAKADIPCPTPLHRQDGELLSSIANKPAAMVSKLSGDSPDKITIQHCSEIGHWLARLHVAGRTFSLSRKTPRDLHWADRTLAELNQHIPTAQYDLLTAELSFQKTVTRNNLPQGIIHSDLFSDNVLFTGTKLSGLLDLYDANTDALLYDVAVTANAWCSLENGCFDQPLLQALLTAYQQVRPLQPNELAAWPAMTCAAALRFWLSRLHHREFPPAGELTQEKPPEIYEKILRQRQSEPLLTLESCG